jgi:hypothetical protein
MPWVIFGFQLSILSQLIQTDLLLQPFHQDRFLAIGIQPTFLQQFLEMHDSDILEIEFQQRIIELLLELGGCEIAVLVLVMCFR